MANQMFKYQFMNIQKLDDDTYKCNQCSKKFDTDGSAKRHYSTLHDNPEKELRPGHVSRAIASKSKKIEDAADRLDITEARLVSFIQNSKHFYEKGDKIGQLL